VLEVGRGVGSAHTWASSLSLSAHWRAFAYSNRPDPPTPRRDAPRDGHPHRHPSPQPREPRRRHPPEAGRDGPERPDAHSPERPAAADPDGWPQVGPRHRAGRPAAR
jgi:hypothetical protein